jgi:hypothetical protein
MSLAAHCHFWRAGEPVPPKYYNVQPNGAGPYKAGTVVWGGNTKTWWDSNGNLHMSLLTGNVIMRFRGYANGTNMPPFCELFSGGRPSFYFFGSIGCTPKTAIAWFDWLKR